MASPRFLGGIALGAGLAYFLDPERGPGRRRRAGERVAGWLGSSLRGHRYGARLGDIEGLEAASLPGGGPGRSGLSPAATVVAGGLLAVYGFTRRGALASAARTLAAGLLAGRVRPPADPAESERRRVVDIQQSIFIAAPVAEVYAFWDSYESFPLFLSGVREIEDLGGGRSRWVVAGPGGEPIEWEAVMTRRDPGTLIAWRSETGSMLANAGAVRFTPENGGTRVDLRFCYQPPAGGGSRAVAELLGADPRARLNHDLARLVAVLEGRTRSEMHGQEPRS